MAKRIRYALDRNLVEFDSQVPRERFGVAASSLRCEWSGHGDTGNIVFAESIPGDGCDKSRVYASRQPDQRASKAVLVEIISRSEDQTWIPYHPRIKSFPPHKRGSDTGSCFQQLLKSLCQAPAHRQWIFAPHSRQLQMESSQLQPPLNQE